MAIYDETHWWKQQLRKYNLKFKAQPPMVLRNVNNVTGRYVPVGPSVHDELNYRYSQYSKTYWEGVKERQKNYLIKTNTQYF
jgi:hypothetical protein